MAKPLRINRAAAQDMAIAALTFIAQDPDRLGRFLAMSGLDPDGVRTAAAEPEFLVGVLDYLSSDEALLVAFTSDAGIEPTSIEAARRLLSHGRGPDRATIG
jgi:Protein of unknown function (DUF3572)